MEIHLNLNGKPWTPRSRPTPCCWTFFGPTAAPSVKRGARPPTAACAPSCWTGLLCCLCSLLAARVDGRCVQTLEGLQEEAGDLLPSLPTRGRAVRLLQSRLCDEHRRPAPGISRPHRTTVIRAYLAGNLCRCSGYEGQPRGIRAYLDHKKAEEAQ